MAKKQAKKSHPKAKPKKISVKKEVTQQDIHEGISDAHSMLKELEAMHSQRTSHDIKHIEHEQEKIEGKEEVIEYEEKKIEDEAHKIEHIEKEIKDAVTQKPLKELHLRDFNKAVVGSFIGVVAHFAFIYGKQIAENISVLRASLLLVLSYLLIIILMHETGYREVKDKKVLWILPKRATAIYCVSLSMIPLIFLLFDQLNLNDPMALFRQIAVTSVLASVGAGTADLIGRD